MTKILIISFLPVYLILSGGLNILLHTCGDSTTVHMMPLSAADPCGESGSDSCCCEIPCCKMELKIFHIDDSQFQSQNQRPVNPPGNDDIITRTYDIRAVPDSYRLNEFFSPLLTQNIPKHKLVCSYLI